MTKPTLLLAASTLTIFSLFASCTHKPADLRVPAAAAESLLEKEQQDLVKNLVVNKDSTLLKLRFLNMRAAQTLTSAFDVRLEKIKTEKDMDALLGSKLYCKILDVRSAHDEAEEQLIYALTLAKTMGAPYEDWFFEQMSAFANMAVENEAAMGQLFIGLNNESTQICGSKSCLEADVKKLTGFHMNPLDQKDFHLFMTKNKGAISANALKSPLPGAKMQYTDLEAGDCFTAEPKRKPQGEGYDWVNRNWVGSVLPTGQFVFTYDDGPHSSYTRVIRDAWADGGMAKPAFFWLRKNASSLSSIVNELNSQGYVIGSHSERHADLGNLAKSSSPADFNGVNRQMFGAETKGLSSSAYADWKSKTLDREINQSVKDLSAIIGKPVRYFRLPYGSGTKNDLIGARFQALNLDHFFWRIDSLDWQDKNPQSIRDRVVGQMNVMKKGIILFHDIHPQSAQAAKLMVQYLKNNPSQKAVSISDLPGLKP